MPPPKLHFCEGNGYVFANVGTDPVEFYHGKEQVIIGCNRLVCCVCKQMVEIGPEYKCGCTARSGSEPRSTDYEDEWESPLPWRCAGHPLATLPYVLDDERIATAADAAALMRRALAGKIPEAARPCEKYEAIAWPAKLYIRVLDTGIEHAVSKAVAACLTDPDARIRAAALWFFQRFPESAGAERIEEVFASKRKLFLDVSDPTTKGKYTLDDRLLGALGGRILATDGRGRIKNRRALEIARKEMLRAGPQPLMSCMSTTDHKWLAANAVAIARASPDGWYWLMISMPLTHFEKVIPRLAKMPGADVERLRKFVQSVTPHWMATPLLHKLEQRSRR